MGGYVTNRHRVKRKLETLAEGHISGQGVEREIDLELGACSEFVWLILVAS